LLAEINERFCVDVLSIPNALLRRKLVRRIDLLKKKSIQSYKEKTFDELDEYVMMLETHRIKLVAKLKAVFDKFDSNKTERLGGSEIEQLLLYMDRPVDASRIHDWLSDLKEKNLTIDFAEFVSKYVTNKLNIICHSYRIYKLAACHLFSVVCIPSLH